MCLVMYPERPTISWEEFAAQVSERRFMLMKKHGFTKYSNEGWKFFKKWYHDFYPQRKLYY